MAIVRNVVCWSHRSRLEMNRPKPVEVVLIPETIEEDSSRQTGFVNPRSYFEQTYFL